MRTTLNIPDDIYRELKIKAAKKGTTVTSLIVEALGSSDTKPKKTPKKEISEDVKKEVKTEYSEAEIKEMSTVKRRSLGL